MYRILGSDGNTEGPVSLEVLRQRLASGQLTSETRVQREGDSEWMPLAALPELATPTNPNPDLGTSTGSGQNTPVATSEPGVRPPLPAISTPPQATPPPLPPAPVRATTQPLPHTSALAIASLILGGIGFCTVGITALLGVPFAIAALWNIRRRQGALTGRALAWIGLVLSVLSLVLVAVALGFLLPFVARMHFQSARVSCVNNLKQVALAVRLQADEHEGKFPPAATWSDAIQSHLNSPNQLRCPDRSRVPCAYAYNRNIAGRTTASVAPETVMLFESDRGWNATIGPEDHFISPPHGPGYSVAFADGSVREVPAAELPSLRWEP